MGGVFLNKRIMKVKILKEHLEFKKGDIVEVSNERGSYWISTGIAIKVKTRKVKNK